MKRNEEEKYKFRVTFFSFRFGELLVRERDELNKRHVSFANYEKYPCTVSATPEINVRKEFVYIERRTGSRGRCLTQK